MVVNRSYFANFWRRYCYQNTIYHLAIDPVTPTTLYALTSEGIFKSTDGGAHWFHHSTGLLPAHVIAIDPARPDRLYAGTTAWGVFKSANGGQDWVASSIGLTGLDTYDLAIGPTSPATLYSGTDQWIFKSADGGLRWSRIFTGNGSARALAIDPLTPTTIYAGTAGGSIYKSEDGGESWEPGYPLDQNGFEIYVLDINPITTTTAYAVVDFVLYKTENGGMEWLKISFPGFVIALAIDPVTPATLYVGTKYVGTNSGVYKSANSGETWQEYSLGLPAGSDVAALVINPTHPDILYAGTDGGVYKSTDGGELWLASSDGLAGQSVVALAIDPRQPETLYAGTASGGVFKSLDGGVYWFPLNAGLPLAYIFDLELDPVHPGTIYASLDRYGIYVYNQTAALSLAKTVDRTAPRPGQRVTYTLTVGNAGPGHATGAVISDTLPAGLTFAGPVTLTPPQPGAILAQDAAGLPALASNLAIGAGQVVTVTLPVTVNAGLAGGAILTNTAAVTATEAAASRTDAVTLTVTAVTPPPGSFSLLSPPAGAIITSTARPVFDWSDAAGAISYTLVITGGPGPLTSTLSAYRPAAPLANGVYTWTVLAHTGSEATAAAGNGPRSLTMRVLDEIYLPLIVKP